MAYHFWRKRNGGPKMRIVRRERWIMRVHCLEDALMFGQLRKLYPRKTGKVG